MRKRLLCVVLTLALLISAQSAAAAAESGNIRSMIITAETRMPIIEVTVPTSGEVYLNPLQLPVEIGGEESDEQILSPSMVISSQSDIPLKVDVKVTGAVKPDSDMSLVANPTNGTGTLKRAFVYFEIQPTDSDDPYYVNWDEKFNSTKHIIVSAVSKTKKDVLTLGPMTREGYVAEDGYAAFRLTGDAVKSPTTPWTEEDGIEVTIAFTFTPVPYC